MTAEQVVLLFLIIILLFAFGILGNRLVLIDRKLNLLLKHLNVKASEIELSEHVKMLAQDPERKIEAIKVLRQETSIGL